MEWKYAVYGGDRRRLYNTGRCCLVCSSTVWAKKSHVEIRKLCSQTCAGLYRRDIAEFICATCGNKFERNRGRAALAKSGFNFCSRACKDIANRLGGIKEIQPKHFGDGKSSYRNRAIAKYGKRCSKEDCPIRIAGIETPDRLLDVDHIDEDRSKNGIENLQVLCVWCHALKTRRENGWKVFGKVI